MRVLVGFVVGVAVMVAVGVMVRERPVPPTGDTRPVVERIREVARLETLTVGVYKKVVFEPAPVASENTLGALAQWAAHAVRPRRAKAIVFADAHLSVDLKRVDARRVGGTVYVVIPDVTTRVELKPLETEVFESTLETRELQEMLAGAISELQAQVTGDAALRRRARESAEHSLRSFLVGAGFEDVQFVPVLPPGGEA